MKELEDLASKDDKFKEALIECKKSGTTLIALEELLGKEEFIKYKKQISKYI